MRNSSRHAAVRPRFFRAETLAGRLIAPTVALMTLAVAANVAFAAWLSASRANASARERESQIAAVLRHSKAAPTLPVLRALQQRTGDEFVVWDAARGRAGFSTLPESALDDRSIRRGLVTGEATLGGRSYRLGEVRLPDTRPSTLVVLAPRRPIAGAFAIAWPFFLMAAATLGLLVPLGVFTARRLAASLGEIDRHVGRISRGEFGHTMPVDETQPDEIKRLVAGVNGMSTKLERLEASLAAGERQRLLGQVASGFAHELRNAVTGAILAIDLHRRRCPGNAAQGDESLAVARRQLEILEEEVNGLLALGKPADEEPELVRIDALLEEVRRLLGPRCDHAGVRLETSPSPDASILGRPKAVRSAVLNLALNGIDAAGAGGVVRLSATRSPDGINLAVSDSGPGPPDSIRDSIREPFVTGKPEGVGLGLAVADAVAGMHGGSLEWRREDGMTVFEMRLPQTTLDGSEALERDRA